MTNYKTKIKNATNTFELSCIWEEVRNAYYNKKTITEEMKNARSREIIEKRKKLIGI